MICIYLHNFLRRKSITRDFHLLSETSNVEYPKNETSITRPWKVKIKINIGFIALQNIVESPTNHA